MLGLFNSLKALTKAQSTNIDNFVFKMHYRLTVIILLVFSILVTATQFYGHPIKCMHSANDLANDLVNTYCWIHSTYSVSSAWSKPVGQHVPYPGIALTTNKKELVYHTYYLWVPLVLFAMAVTFYIPRYIWKIREGGLIKALVSDLTSVVTNEEEREKSISVISKYFRMNLRNNNGLFVAFILCEVLNLVNVLLQMNFINRFLNGAFTYYGWEVLTFKDWEPEVSDDPMVRVFPTMTKCVFYFGGPSGDNYKQDLLCLLPINILNQKIFMLLWFWLWFLLLATLASITFRVITIAIPLVRKWITASHCYPEYRSEANNLVSKLTIPDWFLLELLRQNLRHNYFNDFIENYKKIDKDSLRKSDLPNAYL